MSDNRPSLRLKANPFKMEESIVFVLSLAQKLNDFIDQYQLGKTIYLADVSHLNQLGRPITFSNYSAMKDGPVSSEIYNLLKPEIIKNNDVKWQISSSNGNINYFSLKTTPDFFPNLSKTDMSHLETAYIKIRGLSFKEIRDLTHSHLAWKNAWEIRGQKEANNMNLHDMLEDDDEELIENLIHASSYAA